MAPASQAQDLPEPNALEQRATLYLRHKSNGLEHKDSVRGFDQDRLARVRRNAVIRAVVSGLLSGAIIGGSGGLAQARLSGWDRKPAFLGSGALLGGPSMPSWAWSRSSRWPSSLLECAGRDSAH